LRKKSTNASLEQINSFSDTRLHITDEISFADCKGVLCKLDEKLKNCTQCQEHLHGRHAIAFLGDFCQLEARDVICKHQNSILWEQALNCMVELKGTHRFTGIVKEITCRWREKGLSPEHLKILNSRAIGATDDEGKVEVETPDPLKMQCASWTNKKRCSANASVFEHCLKTFHSECTKDNIPKTAVVARAGAKWANRNGIKLSCSQRKVLFQQCSEAHCQNSNNQHCDPLLCLFFNCPVMGNHNEDVASGIANGSTSLFKKLHLKRNATLRPMQMHGFWVCTVDMEDVNSVEL